MGRRGPNARPVAKVRRTEAQPASKAPAPPATRAEAVTVFLEGLTITAGSLAGSQFRLRPWQREAVEAIYATDATGNRSVRTALASMGRKSGKSTFAAGLALAHLAGPEARPRGQVVSAAADRPQAALIYAEIQAFALADPELAGRLIFRSHNKTVEDAVTGSTFAALSSDGRKAHGLSPSVAICDELAQWRGRELLDALRTGQGAHDEPLMLVISTRSPDPDSPLEELVRYAADVRTGAVDDPTFAGFVHSAPMDLDPFAEATWHVANPGMTPARLADIRILAMQAKRLPSTMPAFNAFVLNRPTETDDRFISSQDWDACAGTAEASGPCFGGLDLAGGASDLCAFSLYWPETKLLRAWAFMPAGRIAAKEVEDHTPYRQWVAAGHLIELPGRAIDRIALGEWLAAQCEGLELVTIAADRWMLADLQQSLDREGITLPISPHGQGFKDMTVSVGLFEALVMDARLRHGGNPLLRAAVASAAIEMDPAGSRKLSKLRSRGRIDALVASVMAIGTAERQPAAPSFEFTGMAL